MVSLLKWNPYQLLMDWLKVHIHIGFETLKVKCIIYGICSQVTFKHAKTMFFSKLGRTDNNFRSYSEISPEGYPNTDLTSPKVRVSIQGPWRITKQIIQTYVAHPCSSSCWDKSSFIIQSISLLGPKGKLVRHAWCRHWRVSCFIISCQCAASNKTTPTSWLFQ